MQSNENISMNLNKFTKAELISKLRRSETKSDSSTKLTLFNQIKSYLSSFWDFLLKLKSIIGKLTLITFFLQLFRKYSIIKRIWKILNSIIVTIFGISLIDNFGFEVINNLLIEFKIIINNTVDYLTNTHFYMFLSKLFSNPSSEIESKSNKTGSMMEEISRKTTNGERKTSESIRQSDRNSKISEWLKPESKIEEIKDQDENVTSNTKYYIIAIMIIGCLSWYYFDDIKNTGFNFIEWIKSFSGNDDPGNNQINEINLPPEDRISQRAELERFIKEKTRDTNDKISDLMVNSGSTSESVGLTSPSLDDLNEKVSESWQESTSPTSSTSSLDSVATVRPSSSKVKIDSVLENSEDPNIGNTSILDLKNNWRNIIKPDLRESIDYVEKHLPKNELDDTSYITQLLNDINKSNINYLKDLNNNTDKMRASKLIYLTDISKNIDNWIEEMKNEINKFE